MTFSLQKSSGKFDGDYNAVNEKTAIISDSFNINVNENTHLEGVDIRAHPLETNASLSTKSLTVLDIENTSSYSAQQSGVSISANMKTFEPNAACPYVASLCGEDQSITKSYISNATNIVRIRDIQPETASLLGKVK